MQFIGQKANLSKWMPVGADALARPIYLLLVQTDMRAISGGHANVKGEL
jgi:hypothetical protein